MLFLNIGNLLVNFQLPGEDAVNECCSASCIADEDHHADQEPCDSDQDCLPDCACTSQFQITALAYNFIEVAGVSVHSYHYVRYMNTYTFEYSDDFLHPPRFG